MNDSRTLSNADMEAFSPEAKVGILATRDAEGLPHLSLITSLMAKNPTQLMFGQFCEGRSKQHVRSEPRVGFAVMTLDRRLWRGTARWTHATAEGDDFIHYNRQAMFRYNAYFGVHTVHYLDLVELGPRSRVSVPALVSGSLRCLAARALSKKTNQPVLKPWARRLFDRIDVLKFAGYIDDQGFPQVVPMVPCLSLDRQHLVLACARSGELSRLPPGHPLAILGLSLDMESVLVRGRSARLRLGVTTLRLDWVYNSMPPIPGPIYPPTPLEPVRDFNMDRPTTDTRPLSA